MSSATSGPLPLPRGSLVDADVLLGHYPFRRFPYPHQDPAQLRDYLQARGIARACLSSLHALFYPDPQQGNDECLPRVAEDPFFIPVAVLNPALPAWRRGLHTSLTRDGVQMVRLAPSYHGYDLAAPEILDCLAELAAQGLLVSIVKRIEDERMHPPLMKVPAVENAAILAAALAHPAPLLLHGAYFSDLADLTPAPNLHVDLAFIETMDTLAATTALLPPTRLHFSSHAPFFYAEAALSKLDCPQADLSDRTSIAGDGLLALLGQASTTITQSVGHSLPREHTP